MKSENGRSLTQSEMLFGSFFFVHKSDTSQKSGSIDQHEEISTIEFLHNTFGEFLTADFVIRQMISEVQSVKALKDGGEVLRAQLQRKLGSPDGFSRIWLACLIYTALHTRPLVLQLIREWVRHALTRAHFAAGTLLGELDAIIQNQLARILTKNEMPPIMINGGQEGFRSPYSPHPVLGHMAVYGINLLLLRAAVSAEPFLFEEPRIGTSADGARPWDQLSHIWRSWFPIESLVGLSGVFHATREKSTVTVRSTLGHVPQSRNRLEDVFNISLSLADDISTGVVGLILSNHYNDTIDLSDLEERLNSENIDAHLEIIQKRLESFELNNETKWDESELINEIIKIMRRIDDAFEMYRSTVPHLRGHENDFRKSIQQTRYLIMHLGRLLKFALAQNTSEWEPDRSLAYNASASNLRALAELNPKVGIDFFKLTRALDGDISGGPFEFFLEMAVDKSGSGEELFELLPNLLQLIIDLDEPEYLYRGDRFMHLARLTRRNPEEAAWASELVLHLDPNRDSTEALPLEALAKEPHETTLRPEVLINLVERDPETAFELVTFAGGAADGWGDRVSELAIERAASRFRRRRLASRRGVALPQEDILNLLLLATECGVTLRVRTHVEEYFESFRQLHLRYLALKQPRVFGRLLRLARLTGSQRGATMMLESLAPFLSSRGRAQRLWERLPLSALADLRWLAEQTMNPPLRELCATIEGVAGTLAPSPEKRVSP